MKLFFSMLFLSVTGYSFAQKDYFLLTGTYTSTGSEGIYVHHFNTGTAESRPLDSVKASNPSFLAIAPDRHTVYAVNENANADGKGGGVSSFSLNRFTGKLTPLSTESSEGNHPCYISTDKTGKWIVVGNYSSGNLAVLPADSTGALAKAITVIQHSGKSADTKRQAGPHVHATVFSKDNRFLFVPDLGMDKLMIYHFDEQTGSLKPTQQAFVQTTPGSGPRHIVFSPNNKFAYLIEELTGAISVYQYNSKKGTLNALQNVSTIPTGFKGYPGSADIHLSTDGKFLYASNRGDANNIAICKVNRKKGTLAVTGYQPVLGKAPRNFSIDPSGKYLLCANQDSDEIVIFLRNKHTGLLTDSGKRIKIPKPVCLKWVKALKE